jgi:MFS family permease
MPVSEVPGASRTPGRGERAWALALTSVAFFMVALDALVVVTALPAVHASLGGSVGTLDWTVNAYTLSFAAGIIAAAATGSAGAASTSPGWRCSRWRRRRARWRRRPGC